MLLSEKAKKAKKSQLKRVKMLLAHICDIQNVSAFFHLYNKVAICSG